MFVIRPGPLSKRPQWISAEEQRCRSADLRRAGEVRIVSVSPRRPSTDESVADARQLEHAAQVVEDPFRCRTDVRSRVATEDERDIVRFEDGRPRVAGEADGVEQREDRATTAARQGDVERQMRIGQPWHIAAEVGPAPPHGDPEATGSRLVASIQLREGAVELFLRFPQGCRIGCDGQLRRYGLEERRREDDALARREGRDSHPREKMLLGGMRERRRGGRYWYLRERFVRAPQGERLCRRLH
jgi:hypothetical protein